ncbi:unnamed protein product, partial [Effrenium voratum]
KVARLGRQQARLNGVSIKGELQPSHALIDLVASMCDTNSVIWVAPSKCSKREREVQQLTKEKTPVLTVEQHMLKFSGPDEEISVDTSTELHWQWAMQRRGIALDQCGLIHWDTHQKWLQQLLGLVSRDPPEGYSRVRLEQLVKADQELFTIMAEELQHTSVTLTSVPAPMDDAMTRLSHDPRVNGLIEFLQQEEDNLAWIHFAPACGTASFAVHLPAEVVRVLEENVSDEDFALAKKRVAYLCRWTKRAQELGAEEQNLKKAMPGLNASILAQLENADDRDATNQQAWRQTLEEIEKGYVWLDDDAIVLPLCWGPFRLQVPSDVPIRQALCIVDLQRFAADTILKDLFVVKTAIDHDIMAAEVYAKNFVNTDSLILPEEVKVAARMIGNAISVCHAAIVLCQCINVYAQVFPLQSTLLVSKPSELLTLDPMKDTVLIKVKSLSGLNAWFRIPITITFGALLEPPCITCVKFELTGMQLNSRPRLTIIVTDFIVAPGHFADQLGNPVPVVKEITSGVTGVLLTNPATLKPWVEAGTTMADEFAALLLDRPEYPIPDVYRIKAATFPVLDSGKNTFLVKGFILQMGQEDVVPLVKNIETTVPTVVNMHCTVDAVDFEAADWAAAQSSPVKFTLNRLKMPEASRVMAVWGRSFRSDGKPCSPKEATSIRFHMAVGENFASDILRQSGFSKVSVTAVKDDYRAVEAILQTVPTHYGYVRGRSGFGVRQAMIRGRLTDRLSLLRSLLW